MSAHHWHADIDSAGAGCTTPPDWRRRAGTAEGSVLPSEDTQDRQTVEDLRVIRGCIERLTQPRSDREKIRAGIIRLLTDPTVLDDDDREVA
jgi:hypothetical protein